MAPLPRPRSDLAAVALGGKIYVFGGCRGGSSFSNEVDIYDVATNTWTTGSPMPTPRAAFYRVGIVNDNVYVIGGWNGGGPLPNNEVYSISQNTWSTAEPMLHPRAEMGVTSQNGRVYTVGGALPAFGNSSDANDVFQA
jgi:N-acetylneuraminic acid mutarotase